MGPGIAIKALLQERFSLMVFGWTQIVMDIQPLIAILTGQGRLHGFTHTYVGALLIVVVAGLSGKGMAEWALRRLAGFSPQRSLITWRVALWSAFLGAFSHVALDSVMHSDMTPLVPLSPDNQLLGWISIDQLHLFCLTSAVVGALLYLCVRQWLSRHCKNGID